MEKAAWGPAGERDREKAKLKAAVRVKTREGARPREAGLNTFIETS